MEQGVYIYMERERFRERKGSLPSRLDSSRSSGDEWKAKQRRREIEAKEKEGIN
jgi:hypothetical protein